MSVKELEEAIEELRALALPIVTEQDYRKHKAVRLGIEAIERVRQIREASIKLVKYNLCDHLLPSETEG